MNGDIAIPGAEPAGVDPIDDPPPKPSQHAAGSVVVWTERKSGPWTQCTYCAVLEALVGAGKVSYPLGLYTDAERDALESADDSPDGQGATFNATDVAIQRRYGVVMSGKGTRMSSAQLRDLLATPGRSLALAGGNSALPSDATNWDPGFQGAHAVGIQTRSGTDVLWLDPLATAKYAGDVVRIDQVVDWAETLNGNSHDPRYLTVGALAEEDEMAWINEAEPLIGVALLEAGQPIRSDPRMTSANVTMELAQDTLITVAFQVEGDEYVGSKDWYGYFLNKGGVRVFHSKQVAQWSGA